MFFVVGGTPSRGVAAVEWLRGVVQDGLLPGALTERVRGRVVDKSDKDDNRC